MKGLGKIITAATALTLIAGSLCGCSDSKQAAKTDGSKFTYWTGVDSATQQTTQSYNELLMYKQMEKETGVKIEFIHPNATADGNDAFNLMTTSKNIPDMIEYSWSNYTGGPDAAIDDGLIIALNDYLKDHAPNFMDYMDGKKGKANNYLYKAQSLTDKGNYYGFGNLNIGTSRGFCGLVLRKDLLDKWNLSVPETIEEWSAVFAKAKAEGVAKPFTCSKGMLDCTNGVNAFNSGFDVGKLFYIENNKVKFSAFEDGYKEYVKQLSDWFKAGYIDIDFVTNDSAVVEANMSNGTSIATFGWVGSTMGKVLPAAQAKNPTYDLVGCPYPAAKKGGISKFQEVQPEANNPAIAISSKCANPEKAVEWCDFLYSEKGMLLKSFGVEGDTYRVEETTGSDGTKEKHYVYTEKITDFQSVGAQSVQGAMYKFFLPANHPGLNQHPDYLNGYYQYQQQKDALTTWNKSVAEAKKHVLPTLSYTVKESEKMTDIKETVDANLNSAISNIILGKADISTYDSVIKTAKDNGYTEMLKITQTAYDRYLKRLKN